jgi:hypothetical protein
VANCVSIDKLIGEKTELKGRQQQQQQPQEKKKGREHEVKGTQAFRRYVALFHIMSNRRASLWR